MEDEADKREGWTTPQIGASEAIHGFHGAVLSVREVGETERFFEEALGFRKTESMGRTIASKPARAAPTRRSL